jgi:predicted TIM-barrel fold metal-dependent hydrolase
MTRIDVHQHLIPPGYVDTLAQHGVHDSGGRSFPAWSSDGALEFMDRFDVGLGMLSVSAPGVWVGDANASAELARRVNDFGAELAKDKPDRFGQLASLPLPDVDGACAEAARAHGELAADGFILFANNAGTYLGDPLYDPLMEQLDELSAVVLVHPTTLPGPPTRGIPTFAVDFLLDTTRAAANLVLHDVPARFPNIKFILSHAGGFTPYASHRIATLTVAHEFQAAIGRPRRSVDYLLAALSGFYFDTALSSSRAALPSLLQFARPERILFGSDYPYPPEPAIAHFAAEYADSAQLDSDLRHAIDHGNAEQLFRRRGAAAR